MLGQTILLKKEVIFTILYMYLIILAIIAWLGIWQQLFQNFFLSFYRKTVSQKSGYNGTVNFKLISGKTLKVH